MKELNTEIKQALLAPFAAAEIRIRTQPYTAAYITARVVMTRLDEVLPWQWGFHLKGEGRLDGNGVMQQDGYLVIRHPDGFTLEFHDRGSAPPEVTKDDGKGGKKMSQAKQAKHAVSDCFKRCAVHIGIGRYLYEIPADDVKPKGLNQAGVDKALAAVGWKGTMTKDHWGAIGGIRPADDEDDYVPTAPAATSDASDPDAPEPQPGPGVMATEDQRQRIADAVERGGGKVESETFRGWLEKNTANHVRALTAVLAEDVTEIIQKLDAIAARRK